MRTRAEAVVARCFQTVPKARFGPLAAGGVLAVAAQLDLVARLLAVIAAVLPVRAVRRHHALTHRMRALLFDAGHDAPPPRHSTTPAGAPPRPAVPVGLDESVIWDRKWRARILPDQCPSGSSFRLRLYPFQEGNIDPERPPKTGGRCATSDPPPGPHIDDWEASLRAFRMATGMATSRAKTSTTIGRNVGFWCNIGCNIRSSDMLQRFMGLPAMCGLLRKSLGCSTQPTKKRPSLSRVTLW